MFDTPGWHTANVVNQTIQGAATIQLSLAISSRHKGEWCVVV